MRLLVACLALLAIAPVASAQMPSPMLKVDSIKVTPGAVVPGGVAAITIEASRLCPSAAMVLDAQEVQVRAAGNGTTTATASLHYPQQVCAQTAALSESANLSVIVPSTARPNSSLWMVAHLGAPAASPTTGPIPEQAFTFTIGTAAASAAAAAASSTASGKQAPAPVAPLLGLGLLAAALRRR